jgi:hypothetical protein
MSNLPRSSLIPSRRTLLLIAVSSLVGGALSLGAFLWLRSAGGVSPSPQPPPHDPRFVPLGSHYHIQLRKAYAAAWEDGAKALDAGIGVSTALDTVAKSWTTRRTDLFDKLVTPEFSKILPESVKDADVSAAERAAMAAAWRGFALGLVR